LRPINTTKTTTSTTNTIEDSDGDGDDNTTNQYTGSNTKIMKITLHTFERLKDHSRRNYNIETYDTIVKDLFDCYNKNNNTMWF